MDEQVRRRRRRGSAGALARRRLLFMLAAMLALLAQALAIQTHVHPRQAALTSTPVAAAIASAHQHRRAPAAPLDCPSCRQLADAATYLAPAPPILVVPGAQTSLASVMAKAAVGGGGRSHAWRSRGPPAAALA